MNGNRRDFLKQVGVLGGIALCSRASSTSAAQRKAAGGGASPRGVLVDTTRCVGCRRCEKACNEINTDLPRRDPGFYKDETVFKTRRRMDDTAYTVVNRHENAKVPSKPVYAKFQCMHCRDAACVSACIVGALTRDATGAIVYDAWKCIGCRYCMVACPFQVPGYEYGNALTPRVRKCNFCLETRLNKGQPPACVQACPMEVMTFGSRADVIDIAKQRIRAHPGRYIPHVYGESEAGGTSWLYLSGVPFKDIDLPRLGYQPAPGHTEPIQHAIFKWFLPPLGLFAALGGVWWYMSSRNRAGVPAGKHPNGRASTDGTKAEP